jgi:hypothetical protein
MLESQSKRRGHAFIPEEAAEWADLYSTEETPVGDKLVVAHYFVAGANWYITEINLTEGIAFGYVDLGNGTPEWGNISLQEMEELSIHGGLFIVERDLYWEAKPAREVLSARAWAWGDK